VKLDQLLETLVERGIALSDAGDQLHYRAPEGALDDDLLNELRAHKQEILAALRDSPETVFYEDSGEIWYQDGAGRFWYADKATGKRSELIPGNPPEGAPLPPSFFHAFGELAGFVASRRLQ
jgi:hypothetical protein